MRTIADITRTDAEDVIFSTKFPRSVCIGPRSRASREGGKSEHLLVQGARMRTNTDTTLTDAEK